MKIPIAKTVFKTAEYENILKPLKSGWVVQGIYVKEFEDKWSKFTGAGESIAVSNCTTAIHLSLSALGIGYGDEVIIPSFTWVATANAVEALGAKPVFCDIDLKTYNIDINKIEEKITKKTKAVIPVHLFGLSAEMDEIGNIAEKFKLFIVEDAACGFAAKYKGKHVGTLGDTGCFSFHPRKAITTGEGGMVTTNNTILAEKLRSMRDHGSKVSDFQRHYGSKPYLLSEFPYLGYNYRLTDIQASIGSTQMDRANDIHSARVYIAESYDNFIDRVSWLIKPFRDLEHIHGFQSYVCLFAPEKINLNNVKHINKMRNDFMQYLMGKGISTRPGTHAVHMLEYYRNKFPNTFIANDCTIAFPIFPSLSIEEIQYIKENIQKYKYLF